MQNGENSRFYPVPLSCRDLLRYGVGWERHKRLTMQNERENKSFPVLWEDGELIFVEKPAGVSAQSPGMPEMISEYLGGTPVYVLHRLDRDVSGVMVYAKTKEAAAHLSGQIAHGAMEKEYLAMTGGAPAHSGEMRDLLYHDPGRNKTFVVKRMRRGVREAILTYQVLGEHPEGTLVKIRLVTGRTHQIRVQFASRGFPLRGDPKYGGTKGKIRLYSHRITLSHPRTGEKITVASLPAWVEI